MAPGSGRGSPSIFTRPQSSWHICHRFREVAEHLVQSHMEARRKGRERRKNVLCQEVLESLWLDSQVIKKPALRMNLLHALLSPLNRKAVSLQLLLHTLPLPLNNKVANPPRQQDHLVRLQLPASLAQGLPVALKFFHQLDQQESCQLS